MVLADRWLNSTPSSVIINPDLRFAFYKINVLNGDSLNIQARALAKVFDQDRMLFGLNVFESIVLQCFCLLVTHEHISVHDKHSTNDQRIQSHYFPVRTTHDRIDQPERHDDEQIGHILGRDGFRSKPQQGERGQQTKGGADGTERTGFLQHERQQEHYEIDEEEGEEKIPLPINMIIDKADKDHHGHGIDQ